MFNSIHIHVYSTRIETLKYTQIQALIICLNVKLNIVHAKYNAFTVLPEKVGVRFENVTEYDRLRRTKRKQYPIFFN